MTARGYLQYHLSHLRRECDWYLPRERTKEIRCAVCHLTRAEYLRKKDGYTSDLMYPKDAEGHRDYRRHMEHWDATQVARTYLVCNCDFAPSKEDVAALEHSLKTGDGLKLAS